MTKSKKKVLFIGQLPPPLHGVSAINSWMLESKLLGRSFEFYPINLTTAKSISDIGKQSLQKYFYFSKAIFITIYSMLWVKPAICYITLNPTGAAFFKDSIILLILKIYRKPIVVHFHGKGIHKWVNSKSNWVKRYYQKVLKNTHLIVLGNSLIHDVEIVYNEKPFVVPNGIPLIDFKPHEPKVNSKLEILFLSNLMEAKGILDFVESVALLNKRDNSFKASIVGDSGDISIDYIKNLVIVNKLQHCVEVLGPKYNEEKYNVLANADVLVFPTHNEAFGLVLLEALQFGLTVITTNEGCILEIIENEVNGYIVEKSSPLSIANTLERLIMDPEILKEIGKRNKAKFQSQYTLNIFDKKIAEIFNKITS